MLRDTEHHYLTLAVKMKKKTKLPEWIKLPLALLREIAIANIPFK